MQGVTRNPLADPGILGVTTGASLAVVIGIAFFGLSSPTAYIWVAIAGAAVAAVFVYAVGSLGRGGATPLKLALAGAATSAAFSLADQRHPAAPHRRAGRVPVLADRRRRRRARSRAIGQVLPVPRWSAPLICLASARGLNSLALGDDLAAGLGERVAAHPAARRRSARCCSAAPRPRSPGRSASSGWSCRTSAGCWSASTTAGCCRSPRWSAPRLLTAADVVGRVVARPAEIDVGIVTALVGAPFFIYIVRRQKVRAL